MRIAVRFVIRAALELLPGPRAQTLEPFGEAFIRLLNVLIVPLMTFTLVSGVTMLEGCAPVRVKSGVDWWAKLV